MRLLPYKASIKCFITGQTTFLSARESHGRSPLTYGANPTGGRPAGIV